MIDIVLKRVNSQMWGGTGGVKRVNSHNVGVEGGGRAGGLKAINSHNVGGGAWNQLSVTMWGAAGPGSGRETSYQSQYGGVGAGAWNQLTDIM